YATANAGSGLTLTPSAVISDGNLGGNYALTLVANNAGVINPAPLTAAIVGNPSKTYDGTTVATLTSGNFTLSGFVGSEGASVIQTTGAYASANAGSPIAVTASLTGQLTANPGTLLANYTLPSSAAGTGTITPAPLT